MDGFIQDLKFSLRSLGNRRSSGVLAIVTFALGIAACTAMFSVVDSVLLQPLAFPEPERIVNVYPTNPAFEERGGSDLGSRGSFSYPELEDLWREGGDVLDGLALTYFGGATIRPASGEPERINVGYTTPDLLGSILGVTPLHGRVFVREDAMERPEAVILGEEYWRNRFDADPQIVGRTMPIGDRAWTVVGVVPEGTAVGNEVPDAWMIIAPWENRGDHRTYAIARLASGVTVEHAESELSAVMAASTPEDHGQHAVNILSRQSELVRNVRTPLLLLLAASVLLLVIAVTNVAALLVGRMLDRQTELSLRTALGASRGRLLRQLMTESLLMASLASALGIVLSALALRGLVQIAPSGLPRVDEVALNPRVLLLSVVVAAVAGLLAGLIPGLLVAGSSLRSGFADSRTTTSQRTWLQNGIAVAQIGMATVLLMGGGLLARTVAELGAADVGFEIEELVKFQVSLPGSSFSTGSGDEAISRDAHAEIARELETLPGVSGVAMTSVLPLSPARGNNSLIAKGSVVTEDVLAERRFVSGGFFEVVGIEIVEGRGIEAADDRQDAPGTMVISQSLARRFWPEGSAVGKTITYWGERETTVIGVAADQRDEALRQATEYAYYVPRVQAQQLPAAFMVRTDNPENQLGAIRERVRSVEPAAAFVGLEPMSNLIRAELDQEAYRARLAALLAFLATLFSIMGIYGVTARSVASRTREFGIRKALGAHDKEVMFRILRQALGLGVVGGLLGLVAAYPVSRAIESQLWGVNFADPLTILGVVLILALGSLLAALGPGRRAGGVDPVTALRAD